MEIKCPDCHTLHDIPDRQIPIGKKWFAFSCQTCENLIKVDMISDSEQFRPLLKQTTKNKPRGPVPEPQLPERLLRGQGLKKSILANLGDLPPMPQIVDRAMDVIRNPNLGISQLAEILEKDQAIVAQILRIANSAYYALNEKVISIQHASVLLGDKMIAEIVTMATATGLLDRTLKGYGLEPEEMWHHSLAVAFGSRIIADKKAPHLRNEAFVAGLLHDAGKIILDKYIYERKEMFKELMEDNQQTFPYVEKQILGFDHSEIAFEGCMRWNFNGAIATAIRFHHYPSGLGANKLAYIVHIADCIGIMSGVGTGIDGMSYQMDKDAMEFLRPYEEELGDIMCEITESAQRVAEKMRMD